MFVRTELHRFQNGIIRVVRVPESAIATWRRRQATQAKDDLENLDVEAKKARLTAAVIEAARGALAGYEASEPTLERERLMGELRAALKELDDAPEQSAGYASERHRHGFGGQGSGRKRGIPRNVTKERDGAHG